ncbi:MAG: MFS transporter [Candidatus Omnitrophica bacterium]|nr:MFS transporter [Candidatus Omnitrophota bacterium]MBU4303632.1 MFS transporter [Candidatus Omnitrophota bacterium]MBU4419310.1 MFS transporter [Candidatus Omnitrophota bacterium]MBU4467936.1 MFS transporter [Candidatus Omnitrophota bacterium]MCG2707626.1 MFS transporter [Candidatus Omnitrophota bacterium]
MKNKKLFWIFALSSAVYFTQGIEGLPAQGLFYYFKETLNFSPEKIMLIGSLTTFAWLVKPLIGYLIDNAFSKRAWIFISLALDIVFVLFLGLIQMPLFILVALLIVTSGNAAFRDVAVDGIMCVEGKKYQATGKIQSIQWVSILIAGLFTGIGGGFIAEKWGYQAGFLCLIPIYLLVGLPAYFYQEEKTERNYSSLFADLKRLFSDKKILVIGLFIFLYKYAPSFGTPLFFIQRDSFKWGKMWIGTLGTLSTVFGVIGALLYYKFSQKINIKQWLYYSVLLGGLTTLSYLYYTPVTAVAYDVVYSFLGMFIFLMVMDFMARHSVKGLEATSFALLCSINNLAGVSSNLSGAFFLPLIGLKWLIVLSALTSFLCLFLINKIE